MIEPLHTPRTILRCWQRADAALLKGALDSSLVDLQQWMDWAMAEPSPIVVIEERLQRFQSTFLAGEDWTYGIFDRTETRVLGGAGLHRRSGPGVLEIGYWIRTDATGQGLATEVAAALTRHAFEAHLVEHVEIRCDPHNLRSAAVPCRLGYRHQETLRNDTVTPRGEPRDTMVWVLTPAEYATPPGAR